MDSASEGSVTLVNGLYRLSYSGKITLPEDCTLVEYGILVSNQPDGSYTSDNFVIGSKINGVSVAKVQAEAISDDGQYKVNINNVKADKVRAGRLYMVYTDANGEQVTMYSSDWVVLTAATQELAEQSIEAADFAFELEESDAEKIDIAETIEIVSAEKTLPAREIDFAE